MGLDQYLYANKFLSNSSWTTDQEKKQFAAIVKELDASKFINTNNPTVQVQFQVAYWRKSNQIHKWFVDTVQDGVDDCREAYVSRTKLKELVDLCQKAVDNKDSAEKILPTQSGFFFGGTDYDEFYWSDLNATIISLTRALTNTPDDYEFYYTSSW